MKRATPRARKRQSPVAAARRVREELHKVGFLLTSDQHFPSVFRSVTGRIPSGSWWGDREGGLVWEVLQRLARDPDVLRVRLLDGKWTYVDRAWFARFLRLLESGASRSKGLTLTARRLLREVERRGSLSLADSEIPGLSRAQAGQGARELEARWLAHSEEVHTPQGLHTKRLQTWARWRARNRARPAAGSARRVQRLFEEAALAWTPEGSKPPRLPWQRRER